MFKFFYLVIMGLLIKGRFHLFTLKKLPLSNSFCSAYYLKKLSFLVFDVPFLYDKVYLDEKSLSLALICLLNILGICSNLFKKMIWENITARNNQIRTQFLYFYVLKSDKLFFKNLSSHFAFWRFCKFIKLKKK